MTGKRGCPKGSTKRKPAEIRKMILVELARGPAVQKTLQDRLSLSKSVAWNHIQALRKEGVVHAKLQQNTSGNGGPPSLVLSLEPIPDPEPPAIRTTIRGPWPTAEMIQRARSTKGLITSSRG